MSTEIIKFDSKNLLESLKAIDDFALKVSEKVEKILPVIPKNLIDLNVVDGDKLEERLTGFLNAATTQSKTLKKERLEQTRKIDEVKKMFTTKEQFADECLSKITFLVDWNTEKLRRKRIEEEKIREQQNKKNALIDFQTKSNNHYTSISNDFFVKAGQDIESEFYKLNKTDLTAFGKEVTDLTILKDQFRKHLIKNYFSFEKENVELTQLHKEVLLGLQNFFNEKFESIQKKIDDLKSFVPSRINQVKDLDEKSREKELQAIKDKQEAEKVESDEKTKQMQQDYTFEKKVDAAIEISEAKVNISLSKGTSVKTKYKPTNHAELLKMIQYYVTNCYIVEDFEKLNSRLSFVRTACDEHLNKDGVIIDGVPIEEVVYKRKETIK